MANDTGELEPQRLWAVIVTYRRAATLATTLAALAAQTQRISRVVVIDNDASDFVAHLVADAPGRLSAEYRAMPENVGPAGGIAAGLAWVFEQASDEDWVVLIDDDDPPYAPTLLRELLQFALAVGGGRTVGAVGVAGGRLDRRRGVMHRLTDDEIIDDVIPVDCFGGNQFPVYRVGALRRAGTPDPRLFWGWEELDLGMKVRRAGFELLAHGDLWRRSRTRFGRNEVAQGRGLVARGSTMAAWRRYYGDRNWIVLLRRDRAIRAAITATARIVAARGLLLVRTRGRARDEFVASLRGLADGWRGVLGRTMDPPIQAEPAPDAR